MIPLTQYEISEQSNINKVTVNKYFQEYMEDGLLEKKNSKYYLTEKAIRLLKLIKSIKI